MGWVQTEPLTTSFPVDRGNGVHFLAVFDRAFAACPFSKPCLSPTLQHGSGRGPAESAAE
jgi:hypothetical protein